MMIEDNPAISKPRRFSRRDLLRAVPGVITLGAADWQGRVSAAETVVVDSHVHVWKTGEPRYPFPGGKEPKEDASPAMLLERMKESGVRKAVLVHPIQYLWDCRYIGSVVRSDPATFMGVCRVDPTSADAPRELTRWTREERYHGVRLSPHNPPGTWFSDRSLMDPLFKRTAELRVPMCLYFPREFLTPVGEFIERYPNLEIVLDHLGGATMDDPESVRKLQALAKHPKVYVKVSNIWTRSKTKEYPFRDTHDLLKAVYDSYGPRRLLWGSNWPGVDRELGYGKTLSMFREVPFLTEEDRRWIFGGTALKLWPFQLA